MGNNGLIIPGFDEGIHFVKEKPKEKPPRREVCWFCPAPATCMPRLYVPCHKLALVQIDDISALLPIPLCDRHFIVEATGPKFVAKQQIRNTMGPLFTNVGSLPDFTRAVVGRIPITDPDYKRGLTAMDKARKT